MARTGRPRNFDRDKALSCAMHLFWKHGFEGASLEQLRLAMGGISSASFYAAFGSKEALYRETLREYSRTHGMVVGALRDPGLSPRRRLEQALRRSAVMQTGPDHPPGCMVALSSTVCSPGSAGVQTVTAAERKANRDAIVACVRAGVDDGTLLSSTDVAGLAALYDGLLLGLSLQARDGVAPQVMDAAISQGLKAWDANCSASASQ